MAGGVRAGAQHPVTLALRGLGALDVRARSRATAARARVEISI
ncbi:hypothetical protein [Mycobacterium avium]|nr:hypothetical protein [Mycobacterium avium]